jgi:hypothetical protein
MTLPVRDEICHFNGFLPTYNPSRDFSLTPRYKRGVAVRSKILLCTKNENKMSKLLRGLAAGYGAKKLGGGCLSTIVIFLILWWLLGHFGIFK